ncbi:IS66 family insertion sequence element accessory protein TnpA [Undibacterium squillarum]
MKVDIEKRQYWEGQIEAWMASGLTQRTFCEREQLKRPTFDYWRCRI